MRKAFYVLFVMIFSCAYSFAQGIIFENSFSEAIQKAKIENKRVFVDVYTSW